MSTLNNTNIRFCHLYLGLIICSLFIGNGSRIFADEGDFHKSTKTTTETLKASGPYCGIYCLYSIMKLSNLEVELYELIKPEYIGSRKGSSLDELRKAAEDNGLYAEAIKNVTRKDIEQLKLPIILHVKYSAESMEYDHYLLLIGEQDGKAKVFDPPNPTKLISFAELAPLWDGNGLIVSAKPIDFGAVFAPARKRFILYLAITISAILALHLLKRFVPVTLLKSRIKFMGLSVAQAGSFVIAAVLIGMFYHFANDAGLLANATATESIQKAHQGNFIPKISEKKVHKLLDSDTVFIDARLNRDYESGHLEGAISVPVDANDIDRQKATADIAKDSRIVMYCQSSGCKYAEIVAIKLKEDGYSNISIYKGGWADWVKKNGRNKETSS